MTTMHGFWFRALVPSGQRVPLLRNSTLALAALLAVTLPAGAQLTDPAGVVQLGPHLDWTGVESTAPHDLRWDERLPGSHPEPTVADIAGDLPRFPAADPADLEGIFRYRFVGEHRVSFAGESISFSNDADCDGFSELLIGASRFLGSGGFGLDAPGAAYLVSMADMEAADAADGIVDRVIDLGLIAAQPRSWKLVGERWQRVGVAVASGGDANGDGCSDLLIGAPDFNSTGSAYVVSAFDLPAADAADGEADGVVDIRRIADQPDSWELSDGARRDSAGVQVTFAGDVNGDGRSDLLIGAPAYNDEDQPGAAYVLSGAALASADAEDGVADGRITLTSVAAQPDSWEFVGENAGDRAGVRLSAANLDSDRRSDFVIGAPLHTAGLERQGAVYLVAASDLSGMDGADGHLDGLIDLGNAAGGPRVLETGGPLGEPAGRRIGRRGRKRGRRRPRRGGHRQLPLGSLDGDGGAAEHHGRVREGIHVIVHLARLREAGLDLDDIPAAAVPAQDVHLGDEGASAEGSLVDGRALQELIGVRLFFVRRLFAYL